MQTHRRAILPGIIVICVVILLSGGMARGAEGPEDNARTAPQLPAVEVEVPPVVDGLLEDGCWQRAAHVEGFWRKSVDAAELQRTEAWICHDSKAIYVAFRAYDTDPSAVVARQQKRQGSMKRDDWVQVCLDVENAGRNEYRFRVNAAGVQKDEVPGGTSEKIEWKGDWRAASRLDEEGWTAEIEVPFSILRYPEGQDCFRFCLERQIGREQDRCVWPKCYAQVSDRDYCARLTEIPTPPVPLRHVIMPYALSVFSEDEEEQEPLTAGLDLKGTWPNGLVGLATFNPDFSNIEDVVETIDFTFVERYLPDPRPFFQEGAGYMPYHGSDWHWGPVNLFYSRRIGDIQLGGKGFGMLGRHRFGLLDAYRRGGENHFVWNYEHLFGTEGNIALSGVDRRVPDEPDNLAMGLGSNWTFPFAGGAKTLNAQWFTSRTEGEGGDGDAVELDASVWRDQELGWYAGYSSVGAEFRADDGYVRETGVHEAEVGLSYPHSHEGGSLLYTEWYANASTGESEQGSRRGVSIDHGRMWRSGWSMWLHLDRGERDGFDVMTNQLSIGWNWQDVYRAGNLGMTWGERYGEAYQYQSLSQAVRLGPCWSARLSVERVDAAYLDSEGNVVPPEWFRQLVLSATYDISTDRSVTARLVGSDGTSNAYAAYRQRVRRGMDLLVVVGDPNATEWVNRLAVKGIWCF